MQNQDIQAAWDYHNGTKHPFGPLMSRWHSFDPMRQPMPFKVYTDLEPIPLTVESSPASISALSALTATVTPAKGLQAPDASTLARILYFSAGVTKKLRFPWGDMSFRAAACTGALYHIELYVVCRDLSGLEAGVYHFDPAGPALRQLRRDNYLPLLAEASGGEPRVANAPATIIFTDVIWRNACKYQAREYRHAFWDSGTILAHTLAVASACNLPAKVVTGFVDETVDRLLDLDGQRENSVVLMPLGHRPEPGPNAFPQASPLHLKVAPVSDGELDFPAIREMHQASSLATAEDVASWRANAAPATVSAPSGPLVPLAPHKGDATPLDSVETVILRRGSSRKFAREPISFQELSTMLDGATRGTNADFLAAQGNTLNSVYLIVNAVDSLASGAYVFHRGQQALELLKQGDFRRQAGYLGLQQDLPADASVNVFFLSDLTQVLEQLGNRGYRAAQLDASIAAGRLYLAAYALRLGATGLTFYDDAVTEFFSPHARGKSVMFLVALGRPVRRAVR